MPTILFSDIWHRIAPWSVNITSQCFSRFEMEALTTVRLSCWTAGISLFVYLFESYQRVVRMGDRDDIRYWIIHDIELSSSYVPYDGVSSESSAKSAGIISRVLGRFISEDSLADSITQNTYYYQKHYFTGCSIKLPHNSFCFSNRP